MILSASGSAPAYLPRGIHFAYLPRRDCRFDQIRFSKSDVRVKVLKPWRNQQQQATCKTKVWNTLKSPHLQHPQISKYLTYSNPTSVADYYTLEKLRNFETVSSESSKQTQQDDLISKWLGPPGYLPRGIHFAYLPRRDCTLVERFTADCKVILKSLLCQFL